MPASISISKRTSFSRLLWPIAALVLAMRPFPAFAQDQQPPQGDQQQKEDRTLQPEEDDYKGTPFTEYGDFNDENEEDEDTKFFQSGRFFGVSAGLGFEGATGNRGAIWQGG